MAGLTPPATGDSPANGRPPSPAAILIAAAFALTLVVLGKVAIGWPPVIIVGGSCAVGFALWLRTYRDGPVPPDIILPPFLLTVAALEVHMYEEYTAQFGPAMSRLFDISWSTSSFLLIFAFAGPVLYTLTALGLYWRKPLAGFVAWFIFIGPGVAEFTHFIFPLLTPALEPANTAPITQAVGNGQLIADMPNYWYRATGRYYFPGLYTALLPMVPGIWAIARVLRYARAARQVSPTNQGQA